MFEKVQFSRSKLSDFWEFSNINKKTSFTEAFKKMVPLESLLAKEERSEIVAKQR
jgi:hypothetical protein